MRTIHAIRTLREARFADPPSGEDVRRFLPLGRVRHRQLVAFRGAGEHEGFGALLASFLGVEPVEQRDRFHPRTHAEIADGCGKMHFDRAMRNAELAGDPFRREALLGEQHALELAAFQAVSARCFRNRQNYLQNGAI